MKDNVAASKAFSSLPIASALFFLLLALSAGADDNDAGEKIKSSNLLADLGNSTAIDPFDRAILLEVLQVFERNQDELWALVGGQISICEREDGTTVNMLQWKGEIVAYSRLSQAHCACMIYVRKGIGRRRDRNGSRQCRLLIAVYSRTTNTGDFLEVAWGNETTFFSRFAIEWKSIDLEGVQLTFTALSRNESNDYVVVFQKERGLFVESREEAPLKLADWAKFLNVDKYFKEDN